jgi:D-amino-acid oxidase
MATARILAECSEVLDLKSPKLLGAKVGLRPFRPKGIRLERTRLRDGRPLVHNYGHGGAGFTVSWGCAEAVLQLARDN